MRSFISVRMDIVEKIERRLAARYSVEEYGALEAQFQEWADTKPLQGLTVLDATPLYDNTLLKYRNLLAAGARLTIGLSPLLSNHPDTLRFAAEELGLPTATEQGAYDLVLDCAAAFCQSTAALGHVELTRSGVPTYQQSNKNVYVADSGRIKEIETEYGTGESCFRALEQLGHTDYAGRRLVLFGAGKVGRGIWREAQRRGIKVEVVADPSTSLIPQKVHDYRNRAAVEELIDGAWAVAMATGIEGALGQTVDAQKAHRSGALLINMGATDEFGPEFDRKRLVAEGRTLNFLLDEPTPLKYIDPTLALHNFGAFYWAARPQSTGLQLPEKKTEDKILLASKLNLIKN